MYKILVEYQIMADRSWLAMITVNLPLNSRTSFKIAPQYVHTQEQFLGEELKPGWGEFVDPGDQKPWSIEAATNFVARSGWQPSVVVADGRLVDLAQEVF